MPIGRYIAWVGASLLVLLFVANWFFPQSLAEANRVMKLTGRSSG